MKQKVSLVFLTFILAVVLSACGATDKNSNADQAANNTPSNTAEGNGSTGAGTPETAEPAELTIKHQLGEAKLKQNPEKVVVFDNGVLDTLDKLGVPVTAVPKDGLPAYLEKYKADSYENAGGLKEPDFEKVNALKPDVIFISGRTSEAYEELNEIAPTIFMGVDNANYKASYTENAKILGQIFGKEAEVEAELAKLDESIAALSSKASAEAASGKKGLIVLTNAGKLSVYGKASRFGLIHDVFGVAPVDENIKASTHGDSVTSEYIAEKNPDYLFVVDRDAAVEAEGGETANKTLENDLIKKTNAYKNGKIIYLNADYWYLSGGGLASMAEMIKEVDAAFN
ncbi:siderophore ABC transporter substrate-binding protein [Paenibacillus spongiae]|uniref:Siderophore ABC transporter substrate-binding protein n=1 Tax=Paenibacillus spongiae TaxID=2909671 RepID=A0ABY5SA00_9BACL|nr:siderophore ABC transporter substrate-binding protein [Paenibacillus spongiae]UVI29553.1 siderophore ABC transporter substrate-binding protein [Paenibacillus spongiae]